MPSFLLTLALPAQLAGALPSDSVDALARRARSAEARFERLSRHMAPFTWRSFSGSSCDEIVGRFCLRFDSAVSPPARPEAAEVGQARREAVEALRRYFSAAPQRRSAAAPLVRLLITDGRAREAVPAARTFAVLSADTLWGDLLLGLALHAAHEDSSAERHFARALARLPPADRRAWLDPEWLLEHDELRGLEPPGTAARDEYERRFWLLADPFWLTPANEAWVEHMARHTQARLLADVPRVAGMLRWGRDLDELTIRYGVPVARSRTDGSAASPRSSLVEYWDTAQRAYAPARLSQGLPQPPPPGGRPLLYSARARSAYAYGPVARVLELPHQATRFLSGDSVVLRVDGLLTVRDSAAGPLSPVGLIVYDTSFGRRRARLGHAVWNGDSALFTLQLPVRPDRFVYSVEALDPQAGVAARARYALDALVPAGGPVVSDLLICRRFPTGPLPEHREDARLEARPSLVVARSDTLGVYAEVYRLRPGAAIGIEVALERATQPSLLGRAARWLGRTLRLVEPESEPRVAWRTDAGDVVHSIALNLPLDPGVRGAHVLVLRVTELASGRSSETRRLLLIRD